MTTSKRPTNETEDVSKQDAEKKAKEEQKSTKISGKYIVPRVTVDAQLDESKKEFTILSHSMIGPEKLKSAWSIYKTKGVEFRDLVPLTPERIILHELAAVMQCNVKQETDPSTGEEVFKKMVEEEHEKLKTTLEYKNTIRDMRDEYKKLGQLIDNFLKSEGKEVGTLSESEQSSIKKFMNKIGKEFKDLTDSELSGVIVGIQSSLYMERARQYANKLVQPALVDLSKLPAPVEKKDTIAIFTVGGPASGKTSSLVKIAKAVEHEYKIKWDDIAHHNLDRARTILLEPGKDDEALNYGNFTSDEARLVRERELKLMSELSSAGQQHHQLYDASEIDAAALQQAAKYRKATTVCLVSTDFETALDRAYRRGKSEGRFVPIDALLRSHKNGPSSLIKALDHDSVTGTNTTVFMYDNNVERGHDSVLFGTINAQKKEIKIHDAEKMALWLRKDSLNAGIALPKTYNETKDHSVDLYVGKTMSIEDYFQPLTTRGYSLKVDAKPELVVNTRTSSL